MMEERDAAERETGDAAPPFEIDPETFRRHAHAFVDWMADYLDEVERYPVRSGVRPGEIAAVLPGEPPEEPEPIERIFEDFRRDVIPGMTHWQHPSFFAYFPANSSPPSVLAEMLTATLAAQCMLWETSPAATEMETTVLDWARRMLGLPEGWTGVIQPTASDATLCALVDARERATGWRSNEAGLTALGSAGARLAVYASEEAHSSVEKAAMLAGIGRRFLRPIETDRAFAMKPAALEAAIDADRASGVIPACVVATLGTTGTGGVDPLEPIAQLCRRHEVYLHVDAAWAGTALLLEEHRGMIAGIETADSFVFNPHKWMLTNFDCSAHYLREAEAYVRAFSVRPAYLETPEGGRVIDYRDWGIPLGRRFRALKLWFVIRAYGARGLREMVRRHIRWTHELAERMAAEPDFEIVAPPSLALFCFRYRPPAVEDEARLDALNERLLRALNDSGRLYLTRNRVRGTYAIRFTVGQRSTTWAHVEAAWDVIRQTARGLEA